MLIMIFILATCWYFINMISIIVKGFQYLSEYNNDDTEIMKKNYNVSEWLNYGKRNKVVFFMMESITGIIPVVTVWIMTTHIIESD